MKHNKFNPFRKPKDNPFRDKRQKYKDTPTILDVIFDLTLELCEIIFDLFN